MGEGKKRKSLSQMAKAQDTEDSKGKREAKHTTGSKSGGGSAGAERGTLRIMSPGSKDKKVRKELESMKVLTPYTVASRLNLRLSVAKDLLEDLHREGIITYVSGGRNIKIYKPSEQKA
jgi:small subunit ribosomal protein S25e